MTLPLDLTPRPLKVEPRPGIFLFRGAGTVVRPAAGCEAAAGLLRTLLELPASAPAAPPEGGCIRLGLDPGIPGPEGYRVSLTPQEARLEAAAPEGLIHAVYTFRQLVPPRAARADIPCVDIEDAPRFAWRGLMLDESRRFFGPETVRAVLDGMALFKLNVFHWHLSDDQGWRIESRRFPRLTEVGAWRSSEKISFSGRPDGRRYGGFYTQDEVRALVAYAAGRGITVVPEFDMPGHSTALLASYPELSCTGGPFQVADRMALFPDVCCPGKESTFAFIEELLDELLPLFPSEYVHTGGDEVLKTRWKACPDCQARMRAEGLKDVSGLQTYFSNRVGRLLARHGKKMIGWHEMAQPGLEAGHAIQYWNMPGNARKITAILAEGRGMVNSAFTHLYLSHGYEFTSLKKAYAFDPLLPAARPFAPQVLGLEATLFSEHVSGREDLEAKLFPRLAAFAESGWSTQKDYPDFLRRLPGMVARLQALGITPAPEEGLNPPALRQLFSIFYRHG